MDRPAGRWNRNHDYYPPVSRPSSQEERCPATQHARPAASQAQQSSASQQSMSGSSKAIHTYHERPKVVARNREKFRSKGYGRL